MSKLQPHQQRVIAELDELEDRLRKLTDFVNDPTGLFAGLTQQDQQDLLRQKQAMSDYSVALQIRIARFVS